MTLKRWVVWCGALYALCLVAACGGGGGGGGGEGGMPGAPIGAQVTLTATGPSGRVPNDSVVDLDVILRNTGSAAASNVYTVFYGYDAVSFVAISCTATGGAVCPADMPPLQTNLYGQLPVELRYTAPLLPAGGSLHFRINERLRSNTSGPMPTSVTSTFDGQTGGALRADVVVTTYISQVGIGGAGAVAPTAAPGGRASYVMSLSNAGPDATANAVVTQDVGLQQTLLSTACAASGGALCPIISGAGATLAVPHLPVGGRLVFTATAAVAPDATGVVGNTVSVSDPGDRFRSDNVRIARVAVMPAAAASSLVLSSDAGDTLGQGASFAYSPATAVFTAIDQENGLVRFGVQGDETWSGRFRLPGGPGQVRPGSYVLPGVGDAGAFLWGGSTSSCTVAQTQLVIHSVAYTGNTLSAIDLGFDHRCNGSDATMRGQFRWAAADTTQPPGPAALSSSLWRPPAASLPASGNYLYLDSDPGHGLAAAGATLMTQRNAIFNLQTLQPGQLNLHMQADEDIRAVFRGLAAASTPLQRGLYGPLNNWPGRNPTVGDMGWTQGSLSCQGEQGWFAIDDIRYAGSAIVSIDARFEHHCEGAPAALRGQLHWRPDDPTVPPGPTQPPPADLWAPPAGATPASGNYVYVESEPGDAAGGGRTALFTPANATFAAGYTAAGPLTLTALLPGGGGFSGQFVGMNSIPRLEPGHYPAAKRYPGHNPTRGGMSVAVLAACNVSTGWFVVDSIRYTGDVVSAIELRFEQRCENRTAALRGKIRWANEGG